MILLAAAPAAKNVLAKLTTAPLTELGEILGDRVRVWRWKNQIRILEEVNAYATKAGLKLKPLHFKALVPLLDGASLEDEPAMQLVWARLIVNASGLDAPLAVATFAAEVLRGITHHEARIVEGIIARLAEGQEAYSPMWGLCIPPYSAVHAQRPILLEHMDRAGLSEAAFSVALDNLARFSVLRIEDIRNLDGKTVGVGCTFTRLGWEAVQLLRARPADTPKG